MIKHFDYFTLLKDAIVEWLLGYMTSQDLDASIVDAEGNTALHLASKYGHIACVKVYSHAFKKKFMLFDNIVC